MNNDIKTCCIDSRRDAINNSYTITDKKILDMIDDYFKRLEEFAKECSDVADFETKFQTSPLAQEYTNLFTKIMGSGVDIKTEAKDAVLYAGEDIVDSVSLRARRKTREKVESDLRNTPIIGDAMTAKQHFDFFSRFKKNK